MKSTNSTAIKAAKGFLPTLDLWDATINADLLAGRLILRAGQWVRCGNSRPSRFVRSTGRSIQAVHPQGEKGVSLSRFQLALACWIR